MTLAVAREGSALARVPPDSIVGTHVVRRNAFQKGSASSVATCSEGTSAPGSTAPTAATAAASGSGNVGATAAAKARVVGIVRIGHLSSQASATAAPRRATALSGSGIELWPSGPVATSVNVRAIFSVVCSPT